MNTDEEELNAITERIIGCAFKVASRLGNGFLEKCYENALAYELRRGGLKVQQQVPLLVYYDDIVVGEFVADLIVEDAILVELKAIEQLAAIHSAQCINYLAATRLPLSTSVAGWTSNAWPVPLSKPNPNFLSVFICAHLWLIFFPDSQQTEPNYAV